MSSPSAPSPAAASPFLDACAVEAWDAWFRWREHGALRDFTVEASWDRVAFGLASAEREENRGQWRDHMATAMRQWRLLPDPRVLRTAGTDAACWPETELGAVLNVAAFVRDPFCGWANLDRVGFRDCAALAVRALDNAVLIAEAGVSGHLAGQPPRLRIGLIGLADAMALLGLGYATPAGTAFACEVAALLAEGTLAGSVQLARERGTRLDLDDERGNRARSRSIPPALIDDARQCGLRHAMLTAIDSQPRLALLANNVADALDPLAPGNDWLQIDAPGGTRKLRSDGFARNLRRRHMLSCGGPCIEIDSDAGGDVAEQIMLRAAVSKWIDAPIDYALQGASGSDPASRASWEALAARHSLPAPRWHLDGASAGDEPRAVSDLAG
jgi:ribonucleoside-diphosphate reductase alpha chain